MIDDGAEHMRDARLEVAARTVDELGGDYVTAEDIGTTTADMDLMSRYTPYVVGRSPACGGGGDPSPVTAETVFRSVGCGLRAATGSADLDGRRVGIVGLGKVGYELGAKLAAGGAQVIACDLDPERVERFADEHGGQAAPSAEAVLATGARRALALRRRRDDRRRDGALDRLPGGGGRGQQPAREPRDRRARSRAAEFSTCPTSSPTAAGSSTWPPSGTTARGPTESVLVDRAEESIERAIATAEAEGSTPLEVAERQALERVEAARA